MSGWFGRKKSPRPSSSPGPQLSGLVNSGSDNRPRLASSGSEVKLEGGGQGLYNPLAWDSMPSVLREKFPHWKESSPLVSQSKSVEEPCFQFSASIAKQPPFTIPYVVMENDTIHSIAVKFETTPTDIARINKKPVTLPLFPGEVIYVPDQDELAHRCESPEEEVGSPVESGDEGEDQQDVEQGEELPPVFEEEVSETHIAVLSKYISEDQGCVYGTLMINTSALMFAPRALDPLIREHGTTGFEAVIPLEDISYAAFSRDISSPRRKLSAALVHTSHTDESHAESADDKDNNEMEQQVNTCISDNQNPDTKQDHENIDGDNVDGDNVDGDNVDGDNVDGDNVDGDNVADDDCAPDYKQACNNERESLNDITVAEEVPAVQTETLTVDDDQRNTLLANKELIQSDGACNIESSTNEGESPSINSDEEMTSPANKEEIPSADNEGDTLILDTEGETSLGDSEVSTPVADRSCSQLIGDDSTRVTESSAPVINVTLTYEGTKVNDEDHHTNHETVAVMKEGGSSTDNLLAQLSLAGSEENQPGGSHTDSAESSDSTDSKFSDQAIFLHLYVSPKSGSVFTYTPINKSVGIDIPNSQKNKIESSIQQVKTHFCFAVAEKRLEDVVHFILVNRPQQDEDKGSPPPEDLCWSAGVYEFISRGSSLRSEDLLFQDDHYTTSSSWEVYSLKDVPRSKIDRMDVENSLPLPTLLETSDLLKDDHLKRLSLHLPSQAIDREWYLIYSTFKHGISLRTMYRNMTIFENEDSPVILVIRDDCGKIFGAAVTCPLRISDKFYGTGESYLFSFDSPTELNIFSWTGLNNYIVKGNSDSFSIGSGDGHPGLWLDEYFYHGSSYNCSTFANDCLASSEDFICSGIEAWGFPYQMTS